MKVKRTVLSSADALECMVTDSLKVDLREVCRAQRDLTNHNWVVMLESIEAFRAIKRMLKEYFGEPECGQMALAIMTTFSRSKAKRHEAPTKLASGRK